MKNKKIIIITVAFLILGCLGFGIINYMDAKDRVDDEIVIVYKDQEYPISYQQLLDYGLTDFQANVKSSGKDPILTDFSGVFLNDILLDHNIILTGNEMVSFHAIDGYSTVVGGDEVLDNDNIYVVLKRNNQFTKGKAEGGSGPMEIVIAKDPFSQRWNKYLVKIVIE